MSMLVSGYSVVKFEICRCEWHKQTNKYTNKQHFFNYIDWIQIYKLNGIQIQLIRNGMQIGVVQVLKFNM